MDLQMSGERIYEDKLYKCSVCEQDKVRKLIDSNSIPTMCDYCRKLKKSNQMRTLHMTQYKERLDSTSFIFVDAPDGTNIKLKNKDEENFYLSKLKKYKEEYNFNNIADLSMLSRMLILEIEMNRMQIRWAGMNLNAQSSQIFTKLSEEIRKIQDSLGISRAKRMDSESAEDPSVLINNLLERFKNFQKEHPEKFIYKCEKCGNIQKVNFVSEQRV